MTWQGDLRRSIGPDVMSLSRNDMLSTDVGGAPRARRSCYVNEPAYGFFIAGSSSAPIFSRHAQRPFFHFRRLSSRLARRSARTVKAMNGVFIRRNPPNSNEDEEDSKQVLLHYEHMDTPWKLSLVESPELGKGPYFGRSVGERSEWCFIDERSNDRFTHNGDTIVPGAGDRWKHVHRTSTGARAPRQRSDWRELAGFGTSQLANAQEDDEDELPWQVIAVLDHDILRQLVGGAEYHKERCREAKAGRGIVDPAALTSLEGCAQPGGGVWIYRVACDRGVAVFEGPSRTANPVGHHAEGDYVRAVEIRHGWLQLDPVARRARYSSRYRREEWVELAGAPGEPAALVRVSEADTVGSTLEGERREEAEGEASEAPSRAVGSSGADAGGSIRHSLAAEVLDQPFVPRLDGGGNEPTSPSAPPAAPPAVDSDGEAFYDAQEDPDIAKAADEAQRSAKATDEDCGEKEAALIAEAVSVATDAAGAIPVGVAVHVRGLSGADSLRYNGSSGVVISPPAESGRQGVRLDAPFANKKLQLRVTNMTAIVQLDNDVDDDEDDEEEEGEGAVTAALAAGRKNRNLVRHARTLGIALADVGLDSVPLAARSPEARGLPNGVLTGFATSADDPIDRLAAATRCAMREADGDDAVTASAELAQAVLEAAIKRQLASGEAKPPADATAADAADEAQDVSDGDQPTPAAAAAATALQMSPDARVRNGALGLRAAAAANAAASPTSVRETHEGLGELKEILLDEIDRIAREECSLGRALVSHESVDALRLRLALAMAHLDNGADKLALEQARDAASAHPKASAADVVFARCLFRVGRREEALAALKQAIESAGKAAKPTKPATAGEGADGEDVDVEEEDDDEVPPLDGTDDSEAKAAARADAVWALSVAEPMLRAERAAERRQAQALELYERGGFSDAAAAYRSALQCIEAGARDDIHARAALHAHIAACNRREKKQAEAVIECDKALGLLPRFGRALFRKAACLLEAGKPKEAIGAFEELYRVDRSWPRLSDWLLRAHAATRRQEEKGDSATSPSGRGRKMPSYGSGGSGGATQGSGSKETAEEGGESGDAISRESDHYVVLGVTCDATEKQIQQAYRMRSLKYHPDRKGGSTQAFQRIAQAFQTLSDADKRSAYDQGVDIKTKRGGGGSDDDSSEEEDEERRQSLREEIERKYYPERYDFWPFGDPFIHKRKREERKRRQSGRRQWYDDDD